MSGSAAFHVAQARMLIGALEELARVQTLMPIPRANTLVTSLRVAREELDAALEELEAADRREVRHVAR